jgi:hypothetical protein
MKSGEDAGMTIKKIPAGITQHFRLANFYWNFSFLIFVLVQDWRY